ncbi:hypothetical protein L3i20_v208830 [Paenibacillus sp. L3-i20]|nr:hypothetical protein L3i20_v208830 [Paenibacillus sp. L3-i20]
MNVVSFLLQSILVLIFLLAGNGKVSGYPMHVESFKRWRLPQWFRVVTGVVQLVGAAALIIGYWEPSWTAAGALLLGFVAIGGVLTHLRVKDNFYQTSTIFIIGLIAFVLFFLNMSALSHFPGFGG